MVRLWKLVCQVFNFIHWALLKSLLLCYLHPDYLVHSSEKMILYTSSVWFANISPVFLWACLGALLDNILTLKGFVFHCRGSSLGWISKSLILALLVKKLKGRISGDKGILHQPYTWQPFLWPTLEFCWVQPKGDLLL